ncbi:hypothetical protein [Enterococcus sp. AZ101]|uniref:hypothetical protein n=1 Tax=Enterococcus sp. AZ101 TaxID=2774742 RepID=UPI003D2A11FF
MTRLLLEPIKMKRLLFGYWLLVPCLYVVYLFTLAAVQQTTVSIIFATIPSLTLTTIIVLLLFFQLFALYKLIDSSDYRASLLGNFLKFSMIQQLCSLNIIGIILCILVYRSLLPTKDELILPKSEQWIVYGVMTFVGCVTVIVLLIRISL